MQVSLNPIPSESNRSSTVKILIAEFYQIQQVSAVIGIFFVNLCKDIYDYTNAQQYTITSTMDKYKIIIVDDHNMFRAGVKTLLKKSQKVEFIGEAVNGEEFLTLMETLKPDIVLMDISMPVMDGIEATRQAVKKYPDIKILGLSMFGEEEYYYKMIQAGVKGFVIKSSGIHELEHAISEVARGSVFFSPELLQHVVKNIEGEKTKTALPSFTDAELQLLNLMAKNFSDDDIASELKKELAEVVTLRSSTMVKADCNNSAGLVMYAIKNKLVQI